MKIFITSRDGSEKRENFRFKDVAESIYHNRKSEEYFTTHFIENESEYVGMLIPISSKTLEAFQQLTSLGRFRICNDNDIVSAHPVYPTLYIENDYD